MAFIRDFQKNQIVDPERGAALKRADGHSYGQDWEIHWDNNVIGFTATRNKTYGGPRRNAPIAAEFFVQSLRIPDKLSHKKPEIISLIREALIAEGLGASFSGPCTVKFDPRLLTAYEKDSVGCK